MSFNLDNIPDKSQLTIPEGDDEFLKQQLKTRIYNKLSRNKLPIKVNLLRLKPEDVTALCAGLEEKGYTCKLQTKDRFLVIN